jgi:hypothetical protein
LGHECFLDIDYDKNDCPLLPSLSDLIKQYSKAKAIQKENEPTINVDFELVDISNYQPPYPLESPSMIPVIQPAPVSSETTNLQENPPLFPTPDLPQNIVPGGDDGNNIPFQENTASGGVKAPTDNTSGRPRRNNVGTYKDGTAIIWRLPINGELYDFSFSNTLFNE